MRESEKTMQSEKREGSLLNVEGRRVGRKTRAQCGQRTPWVAETRKKRESGKWPRDRFKSIGIVTALRIVTGVIDWKIAERGEKPQPLERQRPGGRLELRGRL